MEQGEMVGGGLLSTYVYNIEMVEIIILKIPSLSEKG